MPTLILSDLLSDSGVLLDAHTSGGVTWNRHPQSTTGATYTCYPDGALGNGFSVLGPLIALYYASAAAIADVAVECVFTATATAFAVGGWSGQSGVTLRMNDTAATYYVAQYRLVQSFDTSLHTYLDIVRVDSGTRTTLGTVEVAVDVVGAQHLLRFQAIAGVLSLFWDGAQVLTVTEHAPLPAGRIGVAEMQSGTPGYFIGRLNAAPVSAGLRALPLSVSLDCCCLSLAVCVIVTRADGTVLGFTSHDVDLKIGSVVCEALSSVQASNLRQEIGNGVDNMEVWGLLQSDRITDVDLLAGRYDGAKVKVYIVDWSQSPPVPMLLQSGILGEITVEDGRYKTEVRSLMQRLSQSIGRLTQPTCDVLQLGDSRCKVNLTGTTVSGDAITSAIAIASVIDAFTLTFSGGVNKTGFYSAGVLSLTSGANAGLSREVNIHSDSDVLDGLVAASTPASFGSLGFSNNNGQITNAFTFPIPAGDWSSAFVTVNSGWVAHDPTNLGTDELHIYVPSTQDSLVRQAAVPGTYSDVLTLGDDALNAINAAAGGTLSCGFQHKSQGSGGYFAIGITSCTLTLEGVAAGTSVRIVLQEEFPFPVLSADTGTLVAGCDRRRFTCKAKFNNTINFRGFADLPGTDRLVSIGRHNS